MTAVIKEKEQQSASAIIGWIGRNTGLFSLLVFLLVFLLGFFLLILPAHSRIQAEIEMNNLRLNTEFITENKKELEDLKNLISAYESIRPSYIEKVNKIIPAPELKEKLLTQIETLANNNGLLLKSVSVDLIEPSSQRRTAEAPASQEKVKKIKISLTVIGTNYNNLKNFLRVFENNLRLMDVQRISFAIDKSETQIELHTYILND